MTLDKYVLSFIIRALWSFAISATSFYGLDIVLTINPNVYLFDKRNVTFLAFYFGLTAILELISIIFNLVLWAK